MNQPQPKWKRRWRFVLIGCTLLALVLGSVQYGLRRAAVQRYIARLSVTEDVYIRYYQRGWGGWLPNSLHRAIARRWQRKELVELHLSASGAARELLAELPLLTDLLYLDLSNAGILDEDLPILLRCPQLTHLRLDGNPVTDAGIQQLAAHPNLKYVSAVCDQVTMVGVQRLAAAMGRPEVLEGHAFSLMNHHAAGRVHLATTNGSAWTIPTDLSVWTTLAAPMSLQDLAHLDKLVSLRSVSFVAAVDPEVLHLLEDLPELRRLHLSYLRDDPAALRNVARLIQLEHFSFHSEDDFAGQFDQLQALTRLRTLSVSLRNAEVMDEVDWLRSLSTLKYLTLKLEMAALDERSVERTGQVRAEWDELGRAVSQLSELSGMTLAGGAADAALPGLADMRQLTKLQLRTDSLSPEAVDALRNLTTLKALTLYLSTAPTPAFVEMLGSHPGLEQIRIECPTDRTLDWSAVRSKGRGAKLDLR
ncbi:MAG: hypothetical protein KDA58_05595 [Planctomycetaceae bacterium]|nr:hypothetical protein [Planctomycetaceae bacterium]